jgi:hypothetical protein
MGTEFDKMKLQLQIYSLEMIHSFKSTFKHFLGNINISKY